MLYKHNWHVWLSRVQHKPAEAIFGLLRSKYTNQVRSSECTVPPNVPLDINLKAYKIQTLQK